MTVYKKLKSELQAKHDEWEAEYKRLSEMVKRRDLERYKESPDRFYEMRNYLEKENKLPIKKHWWNRK